MIGRVLPRGQKVAGLVRYLYGPGKAEEHHNPHIVASWSGETASLEPTVTPRGQRDFRQLVGLLEAPIKQDEQWSRTPDPVYHVAVRAAPEDRVLSDVEWGELATEIMHNIGLSQRDAAEAGVRWIAVRHADDHIHIVATLARQDGNPVRRNNDFFRVRETCELFERRYRLRSTAPADMTAARRPHRAELEKARRTGRHETVRDKLRREVRVAAAAAISESDFFARLDAAGVRVKLRQSTVNADEVTGYAVTLPGVRTSDGQPVWYGGGRLAADLTLPKLRQRWSQPGDADPPRAAAKRMRPVERQRVLREAARETAQAEQEMRRLAAENPAAAAAAAYASADAVTVAARVVEGSRGGPLTRAADRFDHAARERYGRVPRSHGRAEQMRSVARLLAAVRRIHPDDDTLQVAELISRMASLADTVAMMRRAQRRIAQAAEAAGAAAELRAQVGVYTGRRVSAAATATPAPAPSRRPPSRPPRKGGPSR
ncbi:relaxase/mobilization nuclease domain-containing protein [Micromonospora sp. CPCC 206061]|uniref:relaxase/mobilization nuclease domain-containing protein n=1 Tax=Micromonospora sp. CPCC 206061 TaxID=3122410 RepID=UPI002FF38F70